MTPPARAATRFVLRGTAWLALPLAAVIVWLAALQFRGFNGDVNRDGSSYLEIGARHRLLESAGPDGCSRDGERPPRLARVRVRVALPTDVDSGRPDGSTRSSGRRVIGRNVDRPCSGHFARPASRLGRMWGSSVCHSGTTGPISPKCASLS